MLFDSLQLLYNSGMTGEFSTTSDQPDKHQKSHQYSLAANVQPKPVQLISDQMDLDVDWVNPLISRRALTRSQEFVESLTVHRAITHLATVARGGLVG